MKKITLLTLGLLFVGASGAFAKIQKFENGCTRTCSPVAFWDTGNWSFNPDTERYACSGQAGPLLNADGDACLVIKSPKGPKENIDKSSQFSANGTLQVTKEIKHSVLKKTVVLEPKKTAVAAPKKVEKNVEASARTAASPTPKPKAK